MLVGGPQAFEGPALVGGPRAFEGPTLVGPGPGPVAPRAARPGRSPDGGCGTFLPAARLVGFLGAGLFPRAPQWLVAWFTARAAPGGLQPGCSEVFIGVSIEMGAVGVLHAFRSRFIGAGRPDALGSSDFQGNLVSPPGSHPVPSVFGLAAPGLACLDPHLVLGFVAGVWVRWRGAAVPPRPQDTNGALCLGGRWKAESPGPCRAEGKCSGVGRH